MRSLKVYAPPTTPTLTTKKLALRGATSPRRHRHPGGRGASPPTRPSARPSALPPVRAQELFPGGCSGAEGPHGGIGAQASQGTRARDAARSRGGARGARGDAASSRDLKGSEGRRDPCRSSARILPPRAKRGDDSAGLLQNSLFVPPPPGAPSEELVSCPCFSASPPPREARKSNRGGRGGASRRGVPPPGRGHSFSCPSTVPGRRPDGSPGAATRLRRERRGSGAMR